MKKIVAAALCLITLLSLFSCNHNNGNITDLSDNDTSDTTTTFFDEDRTDMGDKNTEEQPSENESQIGRASCRERV